MVQSIFHFSVIFKLIFSSRPSQRDDFQAPYFDIHCPNQILTSITMENLYFDVDFHKEVINATDFFSS